MSHQPSTLEALSSTASSAAQTASSTISNTLNPPSKDPNYDPNKDKTNFKKDRFGNTVRKGDYKDKLNEAALDAGKEGNEKGEEKEREEEDGVVAKGISSFQQSTFEQTPSSSSSKEKVGDNKDGPPNRPDHDVQAEQFLRKQYHSRSGQGMPALGKKEDA